MHRMVWLRAEILLPHLIAKKFLRSLDPTAEYRGPFLTKSLNRLWRLPTLQLVFPCPTIVVLMIRCSVYYGGQVQGVGFRYTTQNIARRHDVRGYVKNLADGRVHLVVEGESNEVEVFLSEVADKMANHIHCKTLQRSQANNEFDAGLYVRY